MMDYLSALLTLDGIAIADYEGVRDQGPRRLSADDQRLVTALQSEVETAATLISVSASIANGLELLGPGRVNPRALATFAPPELELLPRISERLIANDLGARLSAALRDFTARTGLAKRMSLAFAAEYAGPDHTRSIDPEVLAHAWRRAAKAAATLLAVLADFEQGSHGNPGAAPGILNLLNAAARGEHPCVEPQGTVVIPGWAERRRHKRLAADFALEIHIGGRILEARAFDVSEGGLGLSGVPEVHAGEAVTARLADGRKLSGRIAWATGGKAGLRFRDRLETDDPLLAGPAH